MPELTSLNTTTPTVLNGVTSLRSSSSSRDQEISNIATDALAQATSFDGHHHIDTSGQIGEDAMDFSDEVAQEISHPQTTETSQIIQDASRPLASADTVAKACMQIRTEELNSSLLIERGFSLPQEKRIFHVNGHNVYLDQANDFAAIDNIHGNTSVEQQAELHRTLQSLDNQNQVNTRTKEFLTKAQQENKFHFLNQDQTSRIEHEQLDIVEGQLQAIETELHARSESAEVPETTAPSHRTLNQESGSIDTALVHREASNPVVIDERKVTQLHKSALSNIWELINANLPNLPTREATATVFGIGEEYPSAEGLTRVTISNTQVSIVQRDHVTDLYFNSHVDRLKFENDVKRSRDNNEITQELAQTILDAISNGHAHFGTEEDFLGINELIQEKRREFLHEVSREFQKLLQEEKLKKEDENKKDHIKNEKFANIELYSISKNFNLKEGPNKDRKLFTTMNIHLIALKYLLQKFSLDYLQKHRVEHRAQMKRIDKLLDEISLLIVREAIKRYIQNQEVIQQQKRLNVHSTV